MGFFVAKIKYNTYQAGIADEFNARAGTIFLQYWSKFIFIGSLCLSQLNHPLISSIFEIELSPIKVYRFTFNNADKTSL